MKLESSPTETMSSSRVSQFQGNVMDSDSIRGSDALQASFLICSIRSAEVVSSELGFDAKDFNYSVLLKHSQTSVYIYHAANAAEILDYTAKLHGEGKLRVIQIVDDGSAAEPERALANYVTVMRVSDFVSKRDSVGTVTYDEDPEND